MPDNNLTCEDRIDTELTAAECWYQRRYRALDRATATKATRPPMSSQAGLTRSPSRSGALCAWSFPATAPPPGWKVALDGHDIVGLTYHFADWFERAERDLDPDSHPALWRLAAHYAEADV